MNDPHAGPKDTSSQDKPYTPTVDQSGEPVEVVRKDLEDQDSPSEGVDKVITPTSTREKEQDAERLNEKNREVERKL
ncbi:hypothetical protein BZK31_01010 [Pseudomonas floridensis]|uniref:Uncharacterized protein n=1 Tax=Pseudomonas floridensis TaxID=1958950 RepID=A0A1X0NCT1_9PSED|nr:hypothetical protein [Pseudomonas floridensis]ORC62248.1 hypothetical protein BZK31_01010 [Pseudomonas floridensis]